MQRTIARIWTSGSNFFKRSRVRRMMPIDQKDHCFRGNADTFIKTGRLGLYQELCHRGPFRLPKKLQRDHFGFHIVGKVVGPNCIGVADHNLFVLSLQQRKRGRRHKAALQFDLLDSRFDEVPSRKGVAMLRDGGGTSCQRRPCPSTWRRSPQLGCPWLK